MMRQLAVLCLAFCAATSAADAQNSVRFEAVGVSEDLHDALLAASRVQQISTEENTPAQDVIAAARSDYARLLAILYEFGYFGPEISIRANGREVAQMSPFQTVGQVETVTIRIEPGRAFRLGRATIAPVASGTDLPAGFVSGETAGTRVLRETAEAGVTGWRSAGHATAEGSGQQITARQGDAVLDVDIRLAPGPVYQFGRLIPQGEERMRTRRIVRIAGLPEGDQFDPEALDRAAERLRDTGVFSSVALTEEPRAGSTAVDIRADVVEAPLRRLGFGAEIASEDGLTLSGYWMHRNLMGGAERLRFDGEVSDIGGNSGGFDGFLSAEFSRPADLTPDTTLSFGVRLEHLDEPLFTEDSARIGIGLEHQFSQNLTGAIGAMVRYSDVSDAFSDRQVWMVALPTTLTWDTRDNAFDAASGWYAAATVTPFSIFNDGSGFHTTADLRAYYGLGEDNRTRLAGRVQLGTVDGGDITTLPPAWLFYSGGSGTVRGQSFQSLGALQNGVQSGGRSFFGASLELRQDLFGAFGAVAFADTGYISSGAYGEGSGEWHSGAGLGLRYDTPIGPIRFDVATPVSGTNAGTDVYVYIGIGQSF